LIFSNSGMVLAVCISRTGMAVEHPGVACACSGMGVDEMYIKDVNTKEEKSSQKSSQKILELIV